MTLDFEPINDSGTEDGVTVHVTLGDVFFGSMIVSPGDWTKFVAACAREEAGLALRIIFASEVIA